MKRYRIIFIFIGICIFFCIVVGYKCLHKPILSEDYNKIRIAYLYGRFELEEKKDINQFVKYINSAYKRETMVRQPVCESPDMMITLTQKNNATEDIDIHGCFMHYKGKQYVINDDKLYDYVNEYNNRNK